MRRTTVLFTSTSFLLAGMLAPATLAQRCGKPRPAGAAYAMLTASMASVSTEPVNKVCPVMGGDVDAESPSRLYKGVSVGFCCPGCEGKWDGKSDDEKMALLGKNAPEAVAAIEAAAKAAPVPGAKEPPPDAGTPASNPAVRVARAYLDACEKADAQALDALFLDKGRVTVSENARDEGTWETYRDHHLLPELREMRGFRMTVTKEDVRAYGSTAIVRQIGSFSVPDPNHKELTKKYAAAVTYVVVDEGGAPKIAHLHWSSRPETKPATTDATPGAAKPDAATGHDHK